MVRRSDVAILRTIDQTVGFEIGEDVVASVVGRGDLVLQVEGACEIGLPDGFRVVEEDGRHVVPRLLGASAGRVEIVIRQEGAVSVVRLDVEPGKLSWAAVNALAADLDRWADPTGLARVEHRVAWLETATHTVVAAERVLQREVDVPEALPAELASLKGRLQDRLGATEAALNTMGRHLEPASFKQVLESCRVRLGPIRPVRSRRLRPTSWVRGRAPMARALLLQTELDPWQPLEGTRVDCRDLDHAYERWCVGMVCEALARRTGQPMPRLDNRSGAVMEIPRGEDLLRVHVEPEYAWQGEGRFIKSVPGRPWRPDIALEHVRGGVAWRLDLIDAKHRRDLSRPAEDFLPAAAIDEVMQRYGETIRDRESGAAVVRSVWVLWPGRRSSFAPRSGPCSGGGLSLVPGAHGVDEVLGTLLDGMLERP